LIGNAEMLWIMQVNTPANTGHISSFALVRQNFDGDFRNARTISVQYRLCKLHGAPDPLGSPTSRKRLSTKPAVCRSGMPKMTFNVRQVWIAASLKRCCRPCFPLGRGVQIISGSNQIDSDPRCLSAAL
jgi:hypothetical protein